MQPKLTIMLKDPQFAGVQFARFKIMQNADGCRTFGLFHGGEWYEFAHTVAQSKARNNEYVSVYPLIFSSDVTYGRKNLPLYPFIVVPGCATDDVRSEPGSWYLIALFPHFFIGPAENAGRPSDGPFGCRRRRVELHPLCIKMNMDDLNEFTVHPMNMVWANQETLMTFIMAATYIVDQNEQDLLCCEPSQRCKTCPCPRD